MRISKKANKYKIVKWKNKLVPVIFGTALSSLSLISVSAEDNSILAELQSEKIRINSLARHTINKATISVASNSITAAELNLGSKLAGATYTITHSKITTDGNIIVSIAISKGGKTAMASRRIEITGINDSKLVNEEKTRINALARHTINKSTTSIAANSITIAELNLGSKVPGATYTITHSEITTDGDIGALIAISKGGKTATALRKITITGVNDANLVNDEKTRINALARHTINKATTSIVANFITVAELNLGSKLAGATYTVAHSEITTDGNIIVSIAISKAGKIATASRRVEITGVNAAKQKLVNDEKTRINALARHTINKATKSIAANSITLSELNLGSKILGATYTVTHNKIIADGNAIVSIAISKGGKTAIASRKIEIIGVNAAKQKFVDDEKTRINALARHTVNKATTRHVNKATTSIAANSLDEFDLNFGFQWQNLKYKITHSEITSDGDTEVSIAISLDDKTAIASRKIEITGVNAAKQKLVDDEKTRINALARHTIDKATTSIAANSITVAELNLGSKVPGATYTITHNKITADGNAIVSITISKGDQTATASRKITITGINDSKLVNEEKTRINGLARHTINKATTSIVANSITVAELNLGSKMSGATYTITHNEITTDGNSIVSIAISKGGKTATASRRIEITGINDSKLVNEEKIRINALARQTINKSTISIAANSITVTELNLGSKLPGATYTITHNKITTDGNTEVSIAISKGSKTATASRRIEITGVNAAKQKFVDDEKTRINALARHTINKATTSIAANSLDGFDLVFGPQWLNLKYKITHSEITSDGNTEVSIAISLDDKTATASRKITIVGVNDSKLVNEEKTRINALARHTINKAQTSIAANSISLSELNIGTKVTGAKYTITHSEITTDGDIEVSIAISKNGQTATATRKIKIAGVNAAKKQANKEIEDVKSAIEAIEGMTKESSTKIDAVTDQAFDKDAFNSLGTGVDFIDTKGTILTYSHNGITEDGTLEIKVKITKDGTDKVEEAQFNIAVSGIKQNKKIVSKKSKGLSTGGIVGIAVGSIAGIVISGMVGLKLLKRRNK